jgi:hypothetical protein
MSSLIFEILFIGSLRSSFGLPKAVFLRYAPILTLMRYGVDGQECGIFDPFLR